MPAGPAQAAYRPGVFDGWSADLSYAYYGRMLDALSSGYEMVQLGDAAGLGPPERPRAIVRHDVDVCPRAALRMAELEHRRGIRTTYHFLLDSPLYASGDPDTVAIVRNIAGLGHEIGLHFDLDDGLRVAGVDVEIAEREVSRAAERLAAVSGEPVRSVSFHRPIATFLRGPLLIAGLVNAYAEALMGWYISDSNACWREGEPLPQLLAPRHPLLQIVVHPIWWGEAAMSCEERLHDYHAGEIAAGRAGDEAELDDRIFKGTGLRRRAAG
jgi:hypothetical protein